jgi:hypothetical protein
MQAADTRIESSTESATAVRRGHIQKWRTRRVNLALCDVRTHMHRSGGRQPPVVYGNAAATAWRNCSRDIRPIHWRAPAQLRYHIHGGLTPAALASECERVPAKLRLLRCTNAHAPGAGASAPRGSRNRTGKGVRLLPWTNACAPGAGGVSPPWLAEPHRQGSATFAMPERMCTRSGGRQPPRGSRNRTGKGVRLLPWTNACAPGAGGVSPPWLAESHRQGSATFAMHERVCTRSGGPQLPVARETAPARECDFCDGRTHMHRSGGRQPPVVHGNARARAFASPSARLPTVHQRTPTQSRCYILDNIHGGLTPAALVTGEFALACAWRFLLHARSRNHGGLTPAALVSECERLPAKLPLLRWTNACAPRAGGVSPPWLAEPHVQVRSRHGQRDCRPCISGLRCSRGATSSTTFTAG